MKFKTEVSLLFIAIALFAVAMFFYSYQSGVGDIILSQSLAYPYRGIALGIRGVWLSLHGYSFNFLFKTKQKHLTIIFRFKRLEQA